MGARLANADFILPLTHSKRPFKWTLLAKICKQMRLNSLTSVFINNGQKIYLVVNQNDLFIFIRYFIVFFKKSRMNFLYLEILKPGIIFLILRTLIPCDLGFVSRKSRIFYPYRSDFYLRNLM